MPTKKSCVLTKQFWLGGNGTGAQWVAGIATLLVVLVALCYNNKSITRMDQALRLTAEADLRPYVTFLLPDELHLFMAGRNGEITYTLENSGKMPAYRLRQGFHADSNRCWKTEILTTDTFELLGPGQTQEWRGVPVASMFEKSHSYLHYYCIYEHVIPFPEAQGDIVTFIRMRTMCRQEDYMKTSLVAEDEHRVLGRHRCFRLQFADSAFSAVPLD